MIRDILFYGALIDERLELMYIVPLRSGMHRIRGEFISNTIWLLIKNTDIRMFQVSPLDYGKITRYPYIRWVFSR